MDNNSAPTKIRRDSWEIIQDGDVYLLETRLFFKVFWGNCIDLEIKGMSSSGMVGSLFGEREPRPAIQAMK